MSPVCFEKWHCPLSLFLNFLIDFEMSPVESKEKGHVALSNLRVKSPSLSEAVHWSNEYKVKGVCSVLLILRLEMV